MGNVSVIGLGNVGRSVATNIVTTGLAERLYVISRSLQKAEGFAVDLTDQSASYGGHTQIMPVASRSMDEILTDTDVAIVTVRKRFKSQAGQQEKRLGGLHYNSPIVAELAKRFEGFSGKVLMVTNPVDIMTRLFFEYSGMQPDQVYGIGSNLDTLRYRTTLARYLGVPLNEVEGQVVGEHGKSMVILFSSTKIGGQYRPFDEAEIGTKVADRSNEIERGAGRVRYGPSGAVISTLRKIFMYDNGIEQLSTYEGGLISGNDNGVFIGLPVNFNNGQAKTLQVGMNSSEYSAFMNSYMKLMNLFSDVQRHLKGE